MIGQTIAHYRITAKLGEGGMGEVYRAVDTKLDREVALKILPAAFAADADRMARFEREAKVLASLNHPNIAQIYGVEERALVMELVEGETLKGPLPLETALACARQIADALEAAHEKGIVHRDLKPANVKITPEGVVKVLDFGLAAVAQASRPESENPANSPTLTMPPTSAGLILGTAGYMSPEQARGKPVDKRADIWAFGVVLYEMLTGTKAFDGEDVAEALAAVIHKEPDLTQVPAPVRSVVERCLRKDPRKRMRDIGDVRMALEEQPTGAEVQPQATGAGHGKLPWMVAGSLLLATLGLGYLAYRHVTEETRVLRLTVLPPEKATADMEAVSPDGRRIVFVGMQEGRSELWVRELDSLSVRLLVGTEDATYPFWSPDSRAIGFFQAGKLKRIDAAGGPALTLCDAGNGRNGSWNRNGIIVFTPNVGSGIYRVAAAGGEATPVTALDRALGENAHRMPWFLPDGHHFLYTARNNDPDKNAIYVADLNSKDRKKILAASSNAVYASPGYLLFLRGATLMAQPFDASSAQTKGDAVPIAEQIRFDSLNLMGRFSVSQNGVLAYSSGSMTSGFTGGAVGGVQLTWFDRSGKVTGTVSQPGLIARPSISPDGRTVAFDRVDQSGHTDIWLFDLARGTESRFTFDSPASQYPIWSPDGSRIAYSSARLGLPGVVLQKPVSGAGESEILDKSILNARPMDWSRDGRYVFAHALDPKTNIDIWVLPQFGDRKAFSYLHTEFNEQWEKLSPNGQWLAYQSDETRRNEIYVQTFPKPEGKWQVSTDGGSRPLWSRDGKELFFIDPRRRMMAVEIQGGAKFQAGGPKVLFDTRLAGGTTVFDVSKDGRFLVPVQVEDTAAEPISVVINWTAGLKK
ncbi:MAG TPA: protein kinase [Bryobacteraceae bacterium]|nr:protein kinase [Bryobacteraceae bacterium]